MAYDAIRMCFLEISEACVKLGALAELHEPDIPCSAIRGFGNHLRHRYDEMDLNAIERAVADLDRLDAACGRAIERLAQETESAFKPAIRSPTWERQRDRTLDSRVKEMLYR